MPRGSPDPGRQINERHRLLHQPGPAQPVEEIAMLEIAKARSGNQEYDAAGDAGRLSGIGIVRLNWGSDMSHQFSAIIREQERT